MRIKVIIAVGVTLLLGVVFILLLSGPWKNSSRVQHLPDGSWLKIISVSYGNSHSYTQPGPNRWQSFVLKYLPASLTARLGIWDISSSVASGARPGESNLGIITIWQQATATTLRSFARLEVFDEQGRLYGIANRGSSSGNSDPAHHKSWELSCWTLDPTVPLDSKKLILRFSELALDGNRQQVAEFVIPNPEAEAKR